jgi:hypothetical protein
MLVLISTNEFLSKVMLDTVAFMEPIAKRCLNFMTINLDDWRLLSLIICSILGAWLLLLLNLSTYLYLFESQQVEGINLIL